MGSVTDESESKIEVMLNKYQTTVTRIHSISALRGVFGSGGSIEEAGVVVTGVATPPPLPFRSNNFLKKVIFCHIRVFIPHILGCIWYKLGSSLPPSPTF